MILARNAKRPVRLNPQPASPLSTYYPAEPEDCQQAAVSGQWSVVSG
jgi:hypothetical protein